MSRSLSRMLLWIAFGLALVVVGTSSGLRLAANGLGCEPWPNCYGSEATAQAVQQSPAAKAARLIHRIAASAFALAALCATIMGWHHWERRARAAAVFVLAVTALLSVLGLYTPSPLPAVTLINVLGGMALLGGIAFVVTAQPTARVTSRGAMLALSALVLLVALQAAAGAMISVRSAGAACELGCGALWLPDAAQLWHPLRPGSADEVVPSMQAGAPLHALHRFGALIVAMLATSLMAVMLTGGGATRTRRGFVALAVCVAFGLLLSSIGGSLWLAIAHVLSAGLLVAGVTALLAAVAGVGRSR